MSRVGSKLCLRPNLPEASPRPLSSLRDDEAASLKVSRRIPGGCQGGGAPIPLSAKSILPRWLRGGSIVAMLGAVVAVPIMLTDVQSAPLAWVPVLIGALAIVALILSYRLKFFTEASYERAKELAQHIGLTETGLMMLEVTYGRLTAEQADRELVRLEEAAQKNQAPVAAQLVD